MDHLKIFFSEKKMYKRSIDNQNLVQSSDQTKTIFWLFSKTMKRFGAGGNNGNNRDDDKRKKYGQQQQDSLWSSSSTSSGASKSTSSSSSSSLKDRYNEAFRRSNDKPSGHDYHAEAERRIRQEQQEIERKRLDEQRQQKERERLFRMTEGTWSQHKGRQWR